MIRILIVDDSPSVTLMLHSIFESQPDMEIAGIASDGAQAVAMARELKPTVITMDVRMPVMDGIEASRIIMQETPTPIVVVSSALNDSELQVTFRALEVGALAVLEKPPGPSNPKFKAVTRDLIDTVRAMAAIKVFRRRQLPGTPGYMPTMPMEATGPELVAIVASTGGPQALADVLGSLPADFHLPIVVVQHIAQGFISGMADWLSSKVPLRCQVAHEGEMLLPGRVYFAPDDRHLQVSRVGIVLRAQLMRGEASERHIPSGNPLFRSVALACEGRAIGVILTGMGNDGAEGLLALRSAGSVTLAQSQGSCVVSSMPQAAADIAAVDEVVPLNRIAAKLKTLARYRREEAGPAR